LASGNTGRNPKTILLEMPLIENKEFGYYRNGKYGARGIVRYGLLFSGGREESLDPPHEDARVQNVAVALTSP
jgi:hypothetical protein